MKDEMTLTGEASMILDSIEARKNVNRDEIISLASKIAALDDKEIIDSPEIAEAACYTLGLFDLNTPAEERFQEILSM